MAFHMLDADHVHIQLKKRERTPLLEGKVFYERKCCRL